MKDLAVDWEAVPAENLTKAGEFTVHGRVLGLIYPLKWLYV